MPRLLEAKSNSHGAAMIDPSKWCGLHRKTSNISKANFTSSRPLKLSIDADTKKCMERRLATKNASLKRANSKHKKSVHGINKEPPLSTYTIVRKNTDQVWKDEIDAGETLTMTDVGPLATLNALKKINDCGISPIDESHSHTCSQVYSGHAYYCLRWNKQVAKKYHAVLRSVSCRIS